MPTDRPTGLRRGLLGAGVAIALALSVAACSDDTDPSSGTTIVTGTDQPATSRGSDPLADCAERMPGDPMSADEAVVQFSPEAICPAYVTVVAGTEVTWINRDDVAHVLTIHEGSTEEGAVLFEQSLEPDEPLVQRYTEATTMTFTLDVQDAFRGTIEVQAAP